MQQADDPPSLPVGTEVSAKYKGAFCEAKVKKVVRNIKVKVLYKQPGLGSGLVPDDSIKSGVLRVGATVEIKHPDRKEPVEAVITKIQDGSQYTVVFDDGDITTLRRTALCLKSGRHFNESETLDQLPLTHPEHFSNPVIGGRRGRRSRHLHDDSSDEDEEPIKSKGKQPNEKEEHIGKVVCVEANETKKKDKEKWFPGLVVSPTAQVTVKIRVKDEYLVRSFKDGRYYTVPKKEATEFTRELAARQDGPAVQAALEYLDSEVLPPHWDRDALFGLNSSSEYENDVDSISSDDEPREEKDHFVAQLYKYMDDRGTPLNKVPSIQNRDVDLYRLFRTVQKSGGYNKVTSQNSWKSIAVRLGFTPITVSVVNLVKQAYKKFLQPYEEFHRKLGCSMLMTPRNANRSKGRSLVRASSVASPKLEVKEPKIPPPPPIAASIQDDGTNSESSEPAIKTIEKNPPKRKIAAASGSKVKNLVEKFEEKIKEEPIPSELKVGKEKTSTGKDKDVKDVKDVNDVKDSKAAVPTLTILSKKEKSVAPKTPKSEEKRGRKKKDPGEITSEKPLEKITASQSVESTSTYPQARTSADFPVEVGDRLKVYYHEKKVTYEAKVIEISNQHGTELYLVHYTGWNNRYDEWIPKERIAYNLTNFSHSKKSKVNNPQSKSEKTDLSAKQESSEKSSIKVITSTSATTAMTSSNKRSRGRSDSQPPRSTTPSSVASNSSRTKSPAAAPVQRRTTPRIPPSAARRISNNVSDISMQTDSDSDSDAPISKKSSKQQTPIKTQPKSNNESETEDDENGKGRDYDLNQIRSELKGFKELKSPSPEPSDNERKSEKHFDFSPKDESIKIEIKTSPTPGAVNVKAEVKSSDFSSETDSFADDDSQSSDKTTQLENMTEKLQQKLKAEKLAIAAANKELKKPTVTIEKLSPLSSSNIEKIIKDSLAEKRQETMKASTSGKPFLVEKSVFKNTISSSKNAIMKEEKPMVSKAQLSRQNSADRKAAAQQLSEIASATAAKKQILQTEKEKNKSTVGKVSEKALVKKETASNSSEILLEPVNKTPPKLSSPPPPPIVSLEKSKSFHSKESISKNITKLESAAASPDVYEFKEPEPFEFESRQKQTDTIDNATKKKKQPLQKSYEMLADMKAAQAPPSSVTNVKRTKKSPIKDQECMTSKQNKQLKLDEKRGIPQLSSHQPLASQTVQIIKETRMHSMTPIVQPSTTVITQPTASHQSPKMSNLKSPETMFDALRKSPSFNLNINALNEELATTVQETIKALTDVIPNTVLSPPLILSLPKIASSVLQSTSTLVPTIQLPRKIPLSHPFLESKQPAENVFELKQDVRNSSSDDDESKKRTELETIKKILSPDSCDFDLDPPKVEKPSSIADKVLKALNQKKEEQENKIKDIKTMPKEEIKMKAMEPAILRSSPLFSIPGTSHEPPKIELPSILLKKDFDNALKKPILNSPEHKLDILESIAPKNNDLTETIHKLESAILKTSHVDHYDDNSDSTDSERRLVIQDDESGPDDTLSAPEFSPLKKSPNKVLGKIDEKQSEVNKELIFPNLSSSGPQFNNKFIQQKHHQQYFYQPSILAVGQVKNLQPTSLMNLPSQLYHHNQSISILSEVGIKPILDHIPFKNDTDKLSEIIGTSDLTITTIKKEDQHLQQPQPSIQTQLNLTTLISQDHSHNDSINLLLCEETIPGSPQPIIEAKMNVHPIDSNIKHIPMDIETSGTSQLTSVSGVSHKITTNTGKVLGHLHQTPPSSSPHDSQSQDDSSEDLTKKQFQSLQEGGTHKKRRRTRKHSETELNVKRRRGPKKANGSDSDENSDANTSQRLQHVQRSLRPCQYNFLVQLDPILNSNQRITILRKKISELRKTYNMIKAELASIDRRRKKLRRREREKKQQQKMQMQTI